MKSKITEIYRGKEVLTNGKISDFPTLEGIISDKISKLDELLSVRLSYAHQNLNSIQQYNIETKNLITNLSTHNSLDIQIRQYNKETKKIINYSPYSNPGYNVFVNLLIGYYEAFKKRPNINFKNLDVEGWNKLRRFENPVSNFLEGIWYNNGIYNYIYNKFLFKENLEGIICPIPMGEGINPNDMERVGFKGDKTVMNLENYSYGFGDDYPGTIVKFIVENDLIPLYLQALIDTNRSAAGADMATNLKKIYEMIFYVLENLENQEGNEEKIEQLIYEVWEKTPLIPESE